MDAYTKDLFQVAAWCVAVVGGLVAAWKAVIELTRSNEQRRSDLRWRQAEMAKRCLDELFGNREARAALKMLDWDGLMYDKPGGSTQEITFQKRRDSLRTKNTVFPKGGDELFIRDAFDALLDHLERLEHLIRIDLIQFADVVGVLRYYVAKLASADERPVIEKFIESYGFTMVKDFLARFDEWNRLNQPQ